MLRSGGIPRTGSAYTGFTHSMAWDRNFEINVGLNQSLLLSNKMNDFICQTSNKTYPHVSTVKLDVSISCGTPDLDAHAEKMGNPIVVFHDVATDCGQQMALYVVNYLLLLLLKHRLHHHGVSIKKKKKTRKKMKKKIIIKFLGLQFSRRDPIFQKLMGPRTPF